MFEKEFQEWFELNKKWLYSMDHVQAAYSAWCAGVKQQQAVEQPLAPDAFLVCGKCGLSKQNHADSLCNPNYQRR